MHGLTREKLPRTLEQNATLEQIAAKRAVRKHRCQVSLEDQPIKAFDDAKDCIRVLFEENVHVASVTVRWSTSQAEVEDIVLANSIRRYVRRDPSLVAAAGRAKRECRAGDPTAAFRRLDAVREFQSLAINDQAIQIAESLLALTIVPKKAAEDALHVAMATAHGMDFLRAWDCRHMANPIIQARTAAHLESIGLVLPFICTPEELLGEEGE